MSRVLDAVEGRPVVMLATSSALVAAIVVIAVLLCILWIAGLWMIFTKANRRGWAALIPFYNTYVLLRVVGRPGWWLVLYFIPIVWWFVALIVLWDLCKSFGRGWGFWWGLFLLPFIFFPVLGFGSAAYVGPAADYEAKDASGRYLRPS